MSLTECDPKTSTISKPQAHKGYRAIKKICFTIIFCLDNVKLKGISSRLRFLFEGWGKKYTTDESLLRSGYCFASCTDTERDSVGTCAHTRAICTQYSVQPNVWISFPTHRCSLSSLKLGHGPRSSGNIYPVYTFVKLGRWKLFITSNMPYMYSRKYVIVTEKGKYRFRNSMRTAQLGMSPLKTPHEAEYSVCL